MKEKELNDFVIVLMSHEEKEQIEAEAEKENLPLFSYTRKRLGLKRLGLKEMREKKK